MRTYTPKPGEIARAWHVIDATDVVLGRLASQTAQLLRGKHKPQFAPHVDTGDFVVIVNAGKVALTGNKRDDKVAYRHSGYPGGLQDASTSATSCAPAPTASSSGRQGHAAAQHARPADAHASSRSTPGPEHPHAAQQPQTFEIKQVRRSDQSQHRP